MPIVTVGSNLNTFGNNGQFETDPSGWGFVGSRTNEQAYSGLYALKYTAEDFLGVLQASLKIAMGSYTGVDGKTYLARARVRVNSANPVGHDDLEFFIFNFHSGITTNVKRTVTEAEDTWVEIESRWTHATLMFGDSSAVWVGITGDYTSGENTLLGGVCYVDKFEIYEYIVTEDPEEPDPDPEEPDETDNTYLSKNPIPLAITAPEDWDDETNYRAYVDVRVEDIADSGVYNSKLKMELPPATNGTVIFYLNEAFRDVFSFNAPSVGEDAIVRLTDRIKRFKCATGELTETATTPSSLEEGDPNLVLYGGINKLRWPSLSYLSTYLPTNKKFLTWAPTFKYVDRLQEDYLNFWIYDEEIVQIKLRIKAYFDDNTNETDVVMTKAVSFKYLYQIPAGPVNSGAAAINAEKNLVRYELTLLDQSDVVISETRTYEIAPYHPLSRHLMFLNSLGAFEVIRMTGQLENTTEFTREVVQRFLPHDYSPSDGEFASSNVTLQPNWNYSSGFIKGKFAKEWHEYMQDFLKSHRIFDVTGGTRTPINIMEGSWSRVDQNYQRFIRFDAKPAYEDQSFTPSSI